MCRGKIAILGLLGRSKKGGKHFIAGSFLRQSWNYPRRMVARHRRPWERDVTLSPTIEKGWLRPAARLKIDHAVFNVAGARAGSTAFSAFHQLFTAPKH